MGLLDGGSAQKIMNVLRAAEHDAKCAKRIGLLDNTKGLCKGRGPGPSEARLCLSCPVLCQQARLADTAHILRLRVHDESDDEAVQTENFGEDEDEDHADEESGLLGGTPHTGVADDTNGESGSKTSETDSKTGTELDEALSERHVDRQVASDEDRDDKTVDGNDTSHDDRDNTLHHLVWPEHRHGGDTDTGFCGPVTCSYASKDDCAGAAHGAEEGGVDGAEVRRHWYKLAGGV